jgi:alpha-1,2-mannosyltransferase
VGVHRLRDLHVFWLAGGAYLHARPVYASVATVQHPPPELAGSLFVYPAPMAALFAPLSLLPYAVACFVFAAVSIGAIAGALWLLGVRDWRCYGAIVLWPMTIPSVTIGTLSPLLLLGVAAIWSFRDRRAGVAGIAAAVLIAKLFLWPVLVWLVASRRSLAAASAAGAAIAVSFLAWLPIGGITTYPRMMHALSIQEGGLSFQPVWLLPGRPELRLAVLEALAICSIAALGFVTRRFGHRSGYVLAVGISLLASPILWPHYLLLLAAPIAIRSRRFSWLWLAPLAMWAYPFDATHHQHTWPVLLLAAVVVVVTLAAERSLARRGTLRA